MPILLFRWHDSNSVIVLLEDADQDSPIPLSSELFAVKSHGLSIPTLAASYLILKILRLVQLLCIMAS
jgi:hypothetical protein